MLHRHDKRKCLYYYYVGKTTDHYIPQFCGNDLKRTDDIPLRHQQTPKTTCRSIASLRIKKVQFRSDSFLSF